MQERYISSGSSRLHIAVWEPSGERKAIMQISHGMIEYIKRYSHFANYLNQAGILVIGNDHKGHGLTAEKDEDLGYFGEEKSAAVIEDLHEVTRYAKEQYGADVPYFLFGHSMGSFMARRYLMTYGEELTGAIICGTGYTPGAVFPSQPEVPHTIFSPGHNPIFCMVIPCTPDKRIIFSARLIILISCPISYKFPLFSTH